MPKHHDHGEWEPFYDEGIITYKQTIDAVMDMGYESPRDFEGHEATIYRNDDGEWGIKIDGEVIMYAEDDEHNGAIWDFYQWWESYFDEPPDREIDSPQGGET